MNEQTRNLALVVAGLSFVAFLVVKLLVGPRRRTSGEPGAHKRLGDAKRRARDRDSMPAARAAALREAAAIALEQLWRPGLAASFARRAERIEPGNGESVGLIAVALRRARRFQALERLLWRRLADEEHRGARYERVLEELIALYESPLRRPEIARALRRLHAS